MKPSPATYHLLRIGFWLDHCHYCIRVAIESRREADRLNAEWWLERAKLHALTAKLHQAAYANP